MTTNQKGAIAEAVIVEAAVRLGIGVSKPLFMDERYDLIFDVRRRLIRVQCKWAIRDGDVVIVRCYSSRRCRAGVTRRVYTSEEIEGFAAYCAELDRCFFLPCRRFPHRRAIQLRLAPTRNNQQRGILWADEFDFEALHWDATALTGP